MTTELTVTIAGLLLAIITGYFTYKTVPRRRELIIDIRSKRVRAGKEARLPSEATQITPMEPRGPVVSSGGKWVLVPVTLDRGHPAGARARTDQWLTKVTITNSGQFDITTQMYDANRPLVVHFGFGVAVLELKQYGPRNGSPPQASVKGNSVLLSPGLLKRKEVVSLEVLTDDKPGSIRVGDPRVDVTLRKTVREATVARIFALALIVNVLANVYFDFRTLLTNAVASLLPGDWRWLTAWLLDPPNSDPFLLLVAAILFISSIVLDLRSRFRRWEPGALN